MSPGTKSIFQLADIDAPKLAFGASVLHVSNVANNAYYNASLLNERGYNNYVVSPDWYHFASCPECVDLDTDTHPARDLGNPYYPLWWRLPRAARARPSWYYGGPWHVAYAGLILDRTGHRDAARVSRNIAEFQSLKCAVREDPFAWKEVWDEATLQKEAKLADLHLDHDDWVRLCDGLRADALIAAFKEAALRSYDEQTVDRISWPFPEGYLNAFAASNPTFKLRLELARNTLLHVCSGIEIFKWTRDQELLRPEWLTPEEFKQQGFEINLPIIKAAASLFDVRVAYAQSVKEFGVGQIYPYAAYEIGTIRTLPFEKNLSGRIFSHAFNSASMVFITNTDHVHATQRLEFEPGRWTYTPHAFDERTIKRAIGEPSLDYSVSQVRFLAPARHDWVRKDPQWSKMNNYIVTAASRLRALGYADFTVAFIDWGVDVDATKSLISEEGLEAHFEWLPLLDKRQLWRLYRACHAVIDQFLIGALSGVSFEALAAGARVITRDDGANAAVFGEAPPFLHAADVDTLVNAMRSILDDPEDTAGRARAGIEWYSRNHDHTVVSEVMISALGAAQRPPGEADAAIAAVPGDGFSDVAVLLAEATAQDALSAGGKRASSEIRLSDQQLTHAAATSPGAVPFARDPEPPRAKLRHPRGPRAARDTLVERYPYFTDADLVALQPDEVRLSNANIDYREPAYGPALAQLHSAHSSTTPVVYTGPDGTVLEVDARIAPPTVGVILDPADGGRPVISVQAPDPFGAYKAVTWLEVDTKASFDSPNRWRFPKLVTQASTTPGVRMVQAFSTTTKASRDPTRVRFPFRHAAMCLPPGRDQLSAIELEKLAFRLTTGLADVEAVNEIYHWVHHTIDWQDDGIARSPLNVIRDGVGSSVSTNHLAALLLEAVGIRTPIVSSFSPALRSLFPHFRLTGIEAFVPSGGWCYFDAYFGFRPQMMSAEDIPWFEPAHRIRVFDLPSDCHVAFGTCATLAECMKYRTYSDLFCRFPDMRMVDAEREADIGLHGDPAVKFAPFFASDKSETVPQSIWLRARCAHLRNDLDLHHVHSHDVSYIMEHMTASPWTTVEVGMNILRSNVS